MAAQARGIDVSHFQGRVDWKQVALSGVDFCFIKATQGSTMVDSYFAQNWAGSAAAGLWQGAYHFAQPGSDPLAQAQFFYKTAGRPGPLGLPPVLDLEIMDGVDAAQVLQWAQQFLNHADALFGRHTMLYTNTGYWQQLQGAADCHALASRALWLAA